MRIENEKWNLFFKNENEISKMKMKIENSYSKMKKYDKNLIIFYWKWNLYKYNKSVTKIKFVTLKKVFFIILISEDHSNNYLP